MQPTYHWAGSLNPCEAKVSSAKKSSSVRPHSSGSPPPTFHFGHPPTPPHSNPGFMGAGVSPRPFSSLQNPPPRPTLLTPGWQPYAASHESSGRFPKPSMGPTIMVARVFLRRPSTPTLRGSSNPRRRSIVPIPRPAALRCNPDIVGQATYTFAWPRNHGLKSRPPPIFLLPESSPPFRFPNTAPRSPKMRPRSHAAGSIILTSPSDRGRGCLAPITFLHPESSRPFHFAETAPRSPPLQPKYRRPGSSNPNWDQMLWPAASSPVYPTSSGIRPLFPSFLILRPAAPRCDWDTLGSFPRP